MINEEPIAMLDEEDLSDLAIGQSQVVDGTLRPTPYYLIPYGSRDDHGIYAIYGHGRVRACLGCSVPTYREAIFTCRLAAANLEGR